jgi:tRNA threonylcarbamoyladenosine biosynthesis protein TsaB
VPSKILALDTSTEACSAALAVGEQRLERFELLPRGHAARILSMLEELLAEAGLVAAELDALTFCRGPGSFTGVRIGCGVAQGIAYGLDLPVAPLSTLQVIAQGQARQAGAEQVLAGIDARMGELYWGQFVLQDGLMQPQGVELVAPAEAVPLPGEGRWHGAGTGWGAYGGALRARAGELLTAVDPQALPRALDCLPLAVGMLESGRTVTAEAALPVYLRDRVTG